MNKVIFELNKKLVNAHENTNEIERELQIAWNEVFKDISALNKAIEQVQASTEYTWNKYGEISSWIRFDFSQFKDCKPYLTEYFGESFIDVDFDNDCLLYNQGPSIVINEDGDVYDQDSDKIFIDSSEYKDDDGNMDFSKRNKLIEEYMNESGYFPGVFRADGHGNVFSVNTQESEK